MNAAPTHVNGDPLAAARLYLQLSPNEPAKDALRTLLRALTDGHGVMREPEAILFTPELSTITAGLLDAWRAGLYSKEEWERSRLF